MALPPPRTSRSGTLWHIVCQGLLVAVIVAAAFGRHEQLVTRVMEVLGPPRRRALQTALAALFAVGGLAVVRDGVHAPLSEHLPRRAP